MLEHALEVETGNIEWLFNGEGRRFIVSLLVTANAASLLLLLLPQGLLPAVFATDTAAPGPVEPLVNVSLRPKLAAECMSRRKDNTQAASVMVEAADGHEEQRLSHSMEPGQCCEHTNAAAVIRQRHTHAWGTQECSVTGATAGRIVAFCNHPTAQLTSVVETVVSVLRASQGMAGDISKAPSPTCCSIQVCLYVVSTPITCPRLDI
jgi:hypothetical protein